MKNLKLFAIFIFLGLYNSSYSSHMMGADLSYKNLGNNKYEVTLRVYRDCRGIPFNSPTIQIRCVKGSSATVTPSYSRISIRDITPTCASAGIACNPQNSTISGYSPATEEHTFKFTYDFSTMINNGCCKVQIGAGQCCRNGAITTGGSGQDFWIVSELNLCVNGGNSSPTMNMEPRTTVACNQPVYYNIGARDYIDNDSLVYELTEPLQSWSTKTTWNSGFSFQNPVTTYCNGSCTPAVPNSYPPRGFFLNRYTGDIVFTPTKCDEVGIYAVKVTEYRKDNTGKYIEVGYVVRDYQFNTVNSSGNISPQIKGPNTLFIADSTESVSVFNTVDNPYKSTSFTINNDTLKLGMVAGPTALNDSTFTVNNPQDKHPSGTFKWKPIGMARSLPYQMLLNVTDNACSYNISSAHNVNIYVRKKSDLAWVEGTLYQDNNLNCKWDSTETIIPNGYVSANNDPSIVFRSDSTGKFSGWYEKGKVTFRVGGEFTNFFCNSPFNLRTDTVNLVNVGGVNLFIKLSGTVYQDSISNCKLDSLDPVLQNQMVYTEPGEFSAYTDSNGHWDMNIPAGVYKIHCKAPLYSIVDCPKSPPVGSIYSGTNIKDLNISLKDTSWNVTDLSLKLIMSETFRVGSKQNAYLVIHNLASKTIYNAKVYLRFNRNLRFESTGSSKYSYKDDSTLVFDISELKGKKNVRFNIIWYIDPKLNKSNDIRIAKTWLDTAGISKDMDLSNNADIRKSIITAAYDPNVKQEVSKDGYAWREGNKLRYHVQFQNTGNDTAVNVVVIDTLPYQLIPQTIQFIGSSHFAEYSLNMNVLKVSFPNIYLPDSSKNETESKGSFEFEINIDPTLDHETKFYNRVHIYFDFAAPVATVKEYTTYTSYVKSLQPDKKRYCHNDVLKLNYTSHFNFSSGNRFKLILSDTLGAFTSGTLVLDTFSSVKNSGNFEVKIPSSIKPGSKYRLKVISTNLYGSTLKDGVSGYFEISSQPKKPVITTAKSLYCGTDSISIQLDSETPWVKIFENSKELNFFTNRKTIKLKLNPGKHALVAYGENKWNCGLSSDTLTFITDTMPKMNLSSPSHSDLKVCENDTVQLLVTGSKSYDLLGNSGVYISTHSNPNIKTLIQKNNDRRLVRGTSFYGCIDTSASLKFTRFNNPIVDLKISDPDFDICIGSSVTFSGTGAEDYQLFKNNLPWLTSFKTNIASSDLKSSDKIYLHGTDINKCKSISPTISIQVNPLPKVAFSANNVCDGDSVFFKNNTTGASDYRWNFGDGSKSNLMTPKHRYAISVTTTFNVRLHATSAESCSDSTVFAVTVNTNPDPEFKYSVTGNSVNFTALEIGNTEYRWYFGTGDSVVSSSPNTSFKYQSLPEGKEVCLKVLNLANCSASSCQTLKADPSTVQPISKSSFKIFPNPTQGTFKIQSDFSGEQEVEIFDAKGRVIQKVSFIGSSYEVNLDVSEGLYFVYVRNGEGYYYGPVWVKE